MPFEPLRVVIARIVNANVRVRGTVGGWEERLVTRHVSEIFCNDCAAADPRITLFFLSQK